MLCGQQFYNFFYFQDEKNEGDLRKYDDYFSRIMYILNVLNCDIRVRYINAHYIFLVKFITNAQELIKTPIPTPDIILYIIIQI